jgi:hypothetical protein
MLSRIFAVGTAERWETRSFQNFPSFLFKSSEL